MTTTPALDATSTAVLGLLRAGGRVAQDAAAIAGNGIGSSAPLLTGGQPSSAASQVFQALQGGSGSTDLAANIVDLVAARTSYQANAAVLKTANDLNKQAINLIS